MIGLTSYGAYIPRLRLNRMAAVKHMGWFAPAVIMVAQGERSMCNWDEDSVTMAVEASMDCVNGAEASGMPKRNIDAVYLASTTLPFADRQNAGIVASALNLENTIMTSDFTASQKAGTTALVSALEAVKSGEKKNVLVTAADKRETKAAYFYELWFGDGAASFMAGSENVIAEYLGSYSLSYDFVDHFRGAENTYDYMWEERWVRDMGYSRIIPEAVDGLCAKLGKSVNDFARIVYPCFFTAEHKKIAKTIGAKPEQVMDNLHNELGETGVAHPFMMLTRALESAEPGDLILAVGFGQGASALSFRVTENILAVRNTVKGFAGSLENKMTTDNYPKWLKFRDLIKTEMGIRAEAPAKTAMTVVWRKNKMLLGLVGGKCTACGTPQYPKMNICVNPACRAFRTQEDYEFAGRSATVMSHTADMLAVSVDPPALYGIIQFTEGGRMMADFTDCIKEDIAVGTPVRMAFKIKSKDKERGFTNYFWKAVPAPGEASAAFQMDFTGKVAVVTGAGGGLGRVYALELGKRGAKVVVNDLGGARDGAGEGSATPAQKVVDEIKALGGDAVANYDNVATEEGGLNIIKTAVDHFGAVDILINNAGILRDKSFVNMTPENWAAVMNVHLNGAYYVTKPAFDVMKEKGFGRIIMTASAAGLYGNFGQTNYSAAKMALVGFMNTLKLEGRKYNIHVNTVAPIAASRLTQDVMPPDMFEKSKPEYVAPMVLYLCHEDCGVTGGIFNTGMGFYSKVSVVTGPGAHLGENGGIPTPEDIRDNWEAVNSMEDPKEFDEAIHALMDLFTEKSAKPEEKSVKDAPRADIEGIFTRISATFRADAARDASVIFGFDITGPGGGYKTVAVKSGALSIADGETAKPDCLIRMTLENLEKLVSGKLNPTSAYMAGDLILEGDIMKSRLIEKLFAF